MKEIKMLLDMPNKIGVVCNAVNASVQRNKKQSKCAMPSVSA